MSLKPFILLLTSGFLLMLGYGLSNILLPVRMQNDGVSLENMGLVLSMLSVVFLIGAYYSRLLLQRVGHIRTFAMCGSLTSVAILLSGIYPEPLMLAGMRIVTGFCIVCTNATLKAVEGYPINRVKKFGNYNDANKAFESCSRFGYSTKKTYEWSPNIPVRQK